MWWAWWSSCPAGHQRRWWRALTLWPDACSYPCQAWFCFPSCAGCKTPFLRPTTPYTSCTWLCLSCGASAGRFTCWQSVKGEAQQFCSDSRLGISNQPSWWRGCWSGGSACRCRGLRIRNIVRWAPWLGSSWRGSWQPAELCFFVLDRSAGSHFSISLVPPKRNLVRVEGVRRRDRGQGYIYFPSVPNSGVRSWSQDRRRSTFAVCVLSSQVVRFPHCKTVVHSNRSRSSSPWDSCGWALTASKLLRCSCCSPPPGRFARGLTLSYS